MGGCIILEGVWLWGCVAVTAVKESFAVKEMYYPIGDAMVGRLPFWIAPPLRKGIGWCWFLSSASILVEPSVHLGVFYILMALNIFFLLNTTHSQAPSQFVVLHLLKYIFHQPPQSCSDVMVKQGMAMSVEDGGGCGWIGIQTLVFVVKGWSPNTLDHTNVEQDGLSRLLGPFGCSVSVPDHEEAYKPVQANEEYSKDVTCIIWVYLTTVL